MAKKSLGYVKLEWICPNCSTRNPGPQKTCTNCGTPQPDNVEFEQAAQAELIKEQAEIAKVKAGPDIHCHYCGTRNPADAKTCSQCGGDLTQGTARASGKVVGAYQTGPAKKIECPACGTPNDPSAPKCIQCGASLVQASAQPQPAPAQAQKGGLKLVWVIAAIIVLMLCVGVLGVMFLSGRSEEIRGTVQGVAWTRTIAIQGLVPVTRADWRDEIPGDAIEVGDCTQRPHHLQDEPAPEAKEICGTPYTVDKGSGYGEVTQDCQYEVYADWCEYTIQEWRQIDEMQLSGRDLQPIWPAAQLTTGQREGEREQTYEIVFDAGDGKVYTYQTNDPEEFARYQPGTTWLLKVNIFDEVTEAEPAQ